MALLKVVRIEPKGIIVELRRIATALEQLLIQEYGYHTVAPKADKRGDDPEVSYSDDLETLKAELRAKYEPDVEEP